LGNLYAAQLKLAAERDLGDTQDLFRQGDFIPLLEWLRAKIHQHGSCFHPGKLIENACGETLSARPLVEYLRGKLLPIYDLDDSDSMKGSA
jgi:carboxypeptidase Taq